MEKNNGYSNVFNTMKYCEIKKLRSQHVCSQLQYKQPMVNQMLL